jgi:hypothetical protein
MSQGSEPVFDKVECFVKASNCKDALYCWSDTAEDQHVFTILQQLSQFEELGERFAAYNINTGEINDHAVMIPLSYHLHDPMQFIVFLSFPGQGCE